MVPEVTLEGDALCGVEPELAPHHLMAALPRAVRLGRRRPKAQPMALKLGEYLDPGKAAALPASTNWRAKAGASLSRMYLNDREGDCVIASKAHALGLWSANDSDAAGVVLATDQEIQQQYTGICGPGDNGCVITDVLDVMRSKGFLAGGKLYPLDAYAAVDWTNKDEVRAAIALFGATCIGINLPQAWTSAAVWDVTNTRVVGGHDVAPIDYDDSGVYVASWGRVYRMTWAAFTSRTWVEEFYVMLAPQWYNADGLAPSGLDVATLRADLDKLSKGVIPDVGPPVTPPGPGPQPPPVTPPAPVPLFTLTFAQDVAAKGRVAFKAPVRIAAGKYGVSSLAAHAAAEAPAKKGKGGRKKKPPDAKAAQDDCHEAGAE